jgi:PAS domain S-box-containing protein
VPSSDPGAGTAALDELHLLDSKPEACFDRITRLAASVLRARLAAMCLADRERVWFKSAWGLERLGIRAREIPREAALCTQALECESVAVWSDLERAMPGHPWVAGGPRLRFFAAAPIHWRDSQIGMLCVADVRARPQGLQTREREWLTEFAALIEDELRLRATVARADAADRERRNWCEQFEVIADAVSDAIFTVDARGTVHSANRAVETVFGYRPKEISGDSLGKIFGAAMLARFQNYFVTNRKTLDWRGTSLMAVHRSGRAVPIEFSLGEFQDRAGKKLAVVVRDRSEQLRIQTVMEARELEFRSVLENVQEVVFRTDLEGRWSFLNPAWTTLTGFTVAESLGRSFLDFAVPEDRLERAERFWTLMEQGCSVLRREVRYRTASGEVRWAEIHARLLFNTQGDTIGTCGTLRDIQDRRAAQQQQEEARKYAESCNAAKNEFLSRASHELRTPMNAILGFAQLLELQNLEPKQAQQVQGILRGGRHLMGLLDELIDISRIESGNLKLHLEPVKLAGVVRAAVDLIRPQAEKRAIAIELGDFGETCVLADARRLTQVLLNLATNAVKYNRDGGFIAMSGHPAEGQRTRLLVRDSGAGLTNDEMARLFQPFERLQAERSKVQGNGLGLAVTKHLMEAMGGAIGVESQPGAGSTFWIELPAFESAAASGAAPDRTGAAAAEVTVLYIDDNDENVLLVKQILASQSNVRLITAEEGATGIDLACQELPGLILLDLHLPGMPGLEVLSRLRSNPLTAAIPIVVLTADVTAETRRQVDEQGVEGWLAKPLHVGRFLETVQTLLGRSVAA